MQALAQSGLAFSDNPYDRDRYHKLRQLSTEIMHEYTGVSIEKLKDLFTGETGYQTPKVDIRSAVFRGDMILMVREKIDGRWSLPGGWADVNTSVSESAIRECLEEAGAIVKPERIVAIHTANRHNNFIYPYSIYKIFVQCRLTDWSFKENTETHGADFFSPDKLPELSTERNTEEQISMCFKAKKSEKFEADFD